MRDLRNSHVLWAGAILLIVMAITVRLIPDASWSRLVLSHYSPDGQFTDDGERNFLKMLGLLRRLTLASGGCLVGVALLVQIAERRVRKASAGSDAVDERSPCLPWSPVGRAEWILVGLACVARLYLASVHLGSNLTNDELASWNNYSSQGLSQILGPSLRQDVNNHVLLSLLNWGTSRVIGSSEVGLRLWSVAFSIGLLLAAHALARLAGLKRGARLAVVGLLTASPVLDYYSTLARGYAPSMFFATAAIVLHLRAWFFGGIRRLVAAGLANTLLMLCLLSNVAVIVTLFGHVLVLGLFPGGLREAWQRDLWGWHLAVTWGAVALACLIEFFLLPFVLAGMVVHGAQGAGFSFMQFSAGLLVKDVSLPGGYVWECSSSVVGALVFFSSAGGLMYGLRFVQKPSGAAVVVMSVTALLMLVGSYVLRWPLRAIVPVHAVAVMLVVWWVDACRASCIAGQWGVRRLQRWVFVAPIGLVAVLLVVGGAWLCVMRTSPEPVLETIALAENLARGRPIWSASILRNQDWNRYYASRPIEFRTSPPDEQSIFIMLLGGHVMSPEDWPAVEFVRSFGHRIGQVAPGFEVWECPPRRGADLHRIGSSG